jgi:hypothetical protein
MVQEDGADLIVMDRKRAHNTTAHSVTVCRVGHHWRLGLNSGLQCVGLRLLHPQLDNAARQIQYNLRLRLSHSASQSYAFWAFRCLRLKITIDKCYLIAVLSTTLSLRIRNNNTANGCETHAEDPRAARRLKTYSDVITPR